MGSPGQARKDMRKVFRCVVFESTALESQIDQDNVRVLQTRSRAWRLATLRNESSAAPPTPTGQEEPLLGADGVADLRTVAHALHDEVLQPLGLIRLLAASAGPGAAPLEQAAQSAIAALRRILDAAWPMALDDFGLEQVLAQQAREVQEALQPPQGERTRNVPGLRADLRRLGPLPEAAALRDAAPLLCRWFGDALRSLGSLREGARGSVRVTLDGRSPERLTVTLRHTSRQLPGAEDHPWEHPPRIARWQAWWEAQGTELRLDSPRPRVWTLQLRVPVRQEARGRPAE